MDSVVHTGRPLLEVQDLQTHFFTRAGRIQAVNGVSFRLMSGETLGVVGESGSGKTITCLSILKLLPRGARIVSGQILFDGEDLVPKTEGEMEDIRGHRIGLILQNSMAALDPVFTIGLQVAEPLVAHLRLSWKAAQRRAVELLRMVRIGAAEIRLKQYPHELSGGMRQRAASAMGLGPMPSLLIADEPTTALDVNTQRQYLDLMKEMQAATGIAIIFVTHDLSLIGNLCDQLAVFYGGSVVEAGAKEKIFAQPAHPYTEALLRAIPMLGHKVERLHSIPGEPPHVARLPAGCPFHPRCDYALEVCRSGAPPPVFTLPDARRVRCWLRENEHGGEPPRSA
jgi:oligopeptide/dipeptide ABC transporter ATP-binding protein